MFKKVALIAALAAMILPVGASASQGGSVSSSFSASATVIAACSKLSVPNLSFGNLIPSNTPGTGPFGIFNPQQAGNYATLNTTNDCTAGASFSYGFVSQNSCNLVGPGGASLPYIIWDAYGTDVLGCSGSTGPMDASNTYGNSVTFLANVAPATFNTPAGSYTDHVTATLYF